MAKLSICSFLIFCFSVPAFALPMYLDFIGESKAGELNSILFHLDGGGLVITRTGAGHFFQEVDLKEIGCTENLALAVNSSLDRSVECSIVYQDNASKPSITEVLDGAQSAQAHGEPLAGS
jgi:hypothetical protein